jgi:hypothetical protein
MLAMTFSVDYSAGEGIGIAVAASLIISSATMAAEGRNIVVTSL